MNSTNKSTAQPPVQPPLYKQAVVAFLGIYPLIMGFSLLFGPAVQQLPLWLNTLVACLVLVSLLTFVVMPVLTKLFARWLNAERP